MATAFLPWWIWLIVALAAILLGIRTVCDFDDCVPWKSVSLELERPLMKFPVLEKFKN